MMIKIPTTIISAFPAMGKTTLAKISPMMFRDLESSDFHWIVSLPGESKIENPSWPDNYISTIKTLDKSGMYNRVFVSAHELVREAMGKAGIKYTLIFPTPTEKMKSIILERCVKRGNDEEFINNISTHFYDYIKSMEEDPYAVMKLALDENGLKDWGNWCAYMR